MFLKTAMVLSPEEALAISGSPSSALFDVIDGVLDYLNSQSTETR